MSSTFLVYVIVALSVHSCTAVHEYYVEASINNRTCNQCQQHCPCQSLNHYANYAQQYFTSHTTLVFSHGRHEFSLEYPLTISDIDHFALVGSNESSNEPNRLLEPSSKIHCTKPTALKFLNVSNLHLANLVLVNCGVEIVGHPGKSSALFLSGVNNLSIYGVIVRNSTGYAILGFNVLGNVTIYGSTFEYNRADYKNWGGNVRLGLTNRECSKGNQFLNVIIQSSRFLFGFHQRQRACAAGLCLYSTSPCYNITVTINDSIFYGNRALYSKFGGNILLLFEENKATSLHSSVSIASSYIGAGKAVKGGGLFYNVFESIGSDQLSDCRSSQAENWEHMLRISDTTFSGNSARRGGGVAVDLQQLCSDVKVEIQNVSFFRNTALKHYDSSLNNFSSSDILVGFEPGYAIGGSISIQDASSCAVKSLILINTSYIANGSADIGGGIHYQHPKSLTTAEPGVCASPEDWTGIAHALHIANTNVTDSFATNDGGGSLVEVRTCCTVQVRFINSRYLRNTASRSGGNIHVQNNVTSLNFSTLVDNCYIEQGQASIGAGLSYWAPRLQMSACDASEPKHIALRLLISNSKITENTCTAGGVGGGMFFGSEQKCVDIQVEVINNTFGNNTAQSGGNICIKDASGPTVRLSIIVENSIIVGGIATLNGGGILYKASDVDDPPSCSFLTAEGLAPMRSLHILDTLIAQNAATSSGGGFGIFINQHCFNVEVDVARVIFHSNEANEAGGSLYIQDTSDVTVQNSIKVRESYISLGRAFQGGGLWYHTAASSLFRNSTTCTGNHEVVRQTVLHISGVQFISNTGEDSSADMFIQISILAGEYFVNENAAPSCSISVIMVEHCRFENASGWVIPNPTSSSVWIDAAGIMLLDNRIKHEIIFKDVLFIHQDALSIVAVQGVYNMSFSDCHFVRNLGTPILATSSNLFFSANSTFIRNVGINGGALALVSNSVLIPEHDAHLYFLDNRAQHAGGAIYVDSQKLFRQYCFFQFSHSQDDFLGNYSIVFNMVNNTAGFAGSAIYGGLVDSCELYSRTVPATKITGNPYPSEIFDALFHITHPESDYSVLSSNPTGVCRCQNDIPDCETGVVNITTYPGATFIVSAISVGQRNGTVPETVILATYRHPDRTQNVFTGRNSTFKGDALCQDVEVRVYTPYKNDTVFLTPESTEPGGPHFNILARLQLNISLLPCPPGFVLNESSPSVYSCDCDSVLDKSGISCQIDDQTVQRPATAWIGFQCIEPAHNCGVILHNPCPFHYCKAADIALHLNNSDLQCDFNHSGILCGACKLGFSRVLGTQRCLKCSNKYLSLLALFMAGGIALVIVLMVSNLTVADGLINGLIFYANIVGVNSALYFPPGETNVLTVFISWINLNFGIEVCFSDGMEIYTKVWLQFVFPAYLSAILIAVIVLTHYSTTASKFLIRKNAVKVLATLFLLSYTKLLNTIVTALSYVTLNLPDGSVRPVWLYDGNIGYLSGKHIPLFVMACLVLLFLALPYTVLLTFAPCIQKRSAHPLLCWYRRSLPLFDAYMGAYKDKYRCWTGVLLLTRVLLSIVFAFNVLGDPAINLLAITVVSYCLLLAGGVLALYKKWPLTVLECSFHFNLGILSVATLYVRHAGGSQSAVTYTSVSIAFAKFVAIFVYQIYQQLKTSRTICCRRVTSIPAYYRRYRSHSYVPVEMAEVATNVSTEELSDSDAVQRSELRRSQQLVLTFDENNEPFLRPLTEDDDDHVVHIGTQNQHGVRSRSSSPSQLNVCQMSSPSPPPWEVGPPSPPPAWQTRPPSTPPAWQTHPPSTPPAWQTRPPSTPPAWQTRPPSPPPAWQTHSPSPPPARQTRPPSPPPAWQTRPPSSPPPAWQTHPPSPSPACHVYGSAQENSDAHPGQLVSPCAQMQDQ